MNLYKFGFVVFAAGALAGAIVATGILYACKPGASPCCPAVPASKSTAAVQIKSGVQFCVPLTDGTTGVARCENVGGQARLTIIAGNQFLDLLLAAWGTGPTPNPVPNPTPTPPTPSPTPPTPAGHVVSLIEISSANCQPCVDQKPILDSLVAEGVAVKMLANTDTEAAQYKATAFPTIIVAVDGMEAARSVGLLQKSQLTAWLTSVKDWADKNSKGAVK